MGQYYLPINLNKKQYLYSHHYGNGLKLTEHSYINNTFVDAVANLLLHGGLWHKDKIVWAGDYMDANLFRKFFIPAKPSVYAGKITAYSDECDTNTNLYSYAYDNFNKIHPFQEKELSWSDTDSDKNTVPKIDYKKYKYLVNWDKKEVARLDELPVQETCQAPDGTLHDMCIHPLPLLVSSGNGGGGGDYHGTNEDLVGSWAGNSISLECDESKLPEDYTILEPNFIEG